MTEASNASWWERRASSLEHDDEVLHGTVTTQAAVVRLRDQLEKAHIARALTIPSAARVLDLGGGAGRLALWIAPRVREVTLVEPSEAHLDVARRLAEARGVDNITFVCSTADAFELAPAAYDVILIGGMLTHLSDAEIEALAEPLSRALAPGGRLVLKEPVSADGRERVDERRVDGELLYVARFRPRERYVELFARLPLLYHRPTLAHPIPFFLGGTNQAAEATGERSSGWIERLTPLWVRADPWLQRLELAVRGTPGLRHLLAPVPVLQDLYVFGAAPAASAGAPGLSVVVIAFNEQECLEPVVAELCQHLTSAGVDFELVLVDDGSSDATLPIMERLASRDARLSVVPLRPNRGIGGALRAGFDAARGEHITWIPADGQIGPDTVAELFARRAEAPMLTTVYVSRADAFYRKVISGTLNTFIRLRSGEVAKSGGNYLFERSAWTEHAPRDDDSMMISTAFRKNLRDAGVEILEVPISARARVAGRSKVLNPKTILRTLLSAAKIAR